MPTLTFFCRLTAFSILLYLMLIGCQDAPSSLDRQAEPTQTAPNPDGLAAQLGTRDEEALPPSLAEQRVLMPSATPAPNPPAPPFMTTTTEPVQAAARLAVPREWLAASQGALSEIDAVSEFEWQLVGPDQAADLILASGSDGLPAGMRPLVLAVPFATDWYETTLSEAQHILVEGHELVTVLDWSAMKPTLRALRVDGRHPTNLDYPLQQPWSLVPSPGFEPAANELAPALESQPFDGPGVHLVAVGDIMLDRALGYAILQGDLDYPFARVAPLLNAADLTFGNLESALGDGGQPELKSYAFRAPPAAAESLARAGFDIVSLANNHALDYGPETLVKGIELLQQQGISPIGAGPDTSAAHSPTIRQVDGLNLAFLAYVNVPVEVRGFDTQSWTATDISPGVAWAVPERIAADVAAARTQSDLVIVSLHSGFEYVDAPSPPQMAAAEAAIDAGAALVIGHHSHVLQGVSFYNDGIIVYGLGNFAFEITGDPSTAILNIWLGPSGVRQLEFVPAVIQFGGQPRLADAWEAPAIHQRIHFLTVLLNAQ